MQESKFEQELTTLKHFFSLYCHDLHAKSQQEYSWHVIYKATCHDFALKLCPTCHENFDYALQRLTACPHEPKPRCRKCKNPCYEKRSWKALAKVMRYSAIKLNFLKIKELFGSRV
jgi:hypothetical protein